MEHLGSLAAKLRAEIWKGKRERKQDIGGIRLYKQTASYHRDTHTGHLSLEDKGTVRHTGPKHTNETMELLFQEKFSKTSSTNLSCY